MSELQQLLPTGDRSWLVRRASSIGGLALLALLPFGIYVFFSYFGVTAVTVTALVLAGLLAVLGLSAVSDVDARPVVLLVFLPLFLAILGWVLYGMIAPR